MMHDVEDLSDTINALLASRDYEWARETLEGILTTVTQTGQVSLRQREAVDHIIQQLRVGQGHCYTLQWAREQSHQRLKEAGWEPNNLQAAFRGLSTDGTFRDAPFYDQKLTELAVVDALVEQGSITAWCGDGVGCVAQMIEAQAKRAEAAEGAGSRLRTQLANIAKSITSALAEIAFYEKDRKRVSYQPHQSVIRTKQHLEIAQALCETRSPDGDGQRMSDALIQGQDEPLAPQGKDRDQSPQGKDAEWLSAPHGDAQTTWEPSRKSAAGSEPAESLQCLRTQLAQLREKWRKQSEEERREADWLDGCNGRKLDPERRLELWHHADALKDTIADLDALLQAGQPSKKDKI